MAAEQTLGLRMWLILVAACGLAFLPFLLAGFSFEFHFLMVFLQGPAMGFAAVRLLQRYPATYAFAGAVEGVFLMTFVSLFGLLVCYTAAAVGAPLADARLVQVDHWLGYDWQAYARFCVAHPWLLQVFRVAYGTIFPQPVIIGAILFLTRHGLRFEKFVLANLISVALIAILFMLLPATTAWSFQGQEALATHILRDLPTSANSWVGDLIQIRGGAGRHVIRLAGLVAFPSFHCVAALLNIWAVWPLRPARVPFALLNLLMIAATPLIGGHYVADLIGGAAVTLLTLWAVDGVHRRLLDARLLRVGGVIPWMAGRHGRPHLHPQG